MYGPQFPPPPLFGRHHTVCVLSNQQKRESAVHCDSLVRYLGKGRDHCPGGSWPWPTCRATTSESIQYPHECVAPPFFPGGSGPLLNVHSPHAPTRWGEEGGIGGKIFFCISIEWCHLAVPRYTRLDLAKKTDKGTSMGKEVGGGGYWGCVWRHGARVRWTRRLLIAKVTYIRDLANSPDISLSLFVIGQHFHRIL